jgi:DNA-binding transcriptional regulator YiaG
MSVVPPIATGLDVPDGSFVPSIEESGRFTRSAHRRVRSSFPIAKKGTDLGRRRLDLDYNGVFDGLQPVEDTFGVPANIARSHDELLRADRRFHFALHNVGNRFVRVGVKRGADSRRIVDLEECHLVALDKRLDEHIAAIHRLALDGTYHHLFEDPCPASKTSSTGSMKKTKKKKATPRSASEVDAFIGAKMRDRRTKLGLSQSAMGAKLHVSFQQIQKYESGKNRVSAARLFEICEALEVSLASMFERELKA